MINFHAPFSFFLFSRAIYVAVVVWLGGVESSSFTGGHEYVEHRFFLIPLPIIQMLESIDSILAFMKHSRFSWLIKRAVFITSCGVHCIHRRFASWQFRDWISGYLSERLKFNDSKKADHKRRRWIHPFNCIAWSLNWIDFESSVLTSRWNGVHD